jgi:hypothetical protein
MSQSWRDMTWQQFIERLLWTAGGVVAAFSAATFFLMPSSDMIRWVRRTDTIEERLSRVFNTPEEQATVIRKLANTQERLNEAQEALLKSRANSDTLQQGLDAESKKTALLNSQTTKLERELNDTKAKLLQAKQNNRKCDESPVLFNNVAIHSAGTETLINGRLSISVSYISPGIPLGCNYQFNSDTGDRSFGYSNRVGDISKIKTSAGTFRVLLAKIDTNAETCTFNISSDEAAE